MATLAVIFPPTQAPERLGTVAAAAEAAGLPELWVWEDCFSESGIATATAILAATSHVRVRIGLLPVPLRNVALTAMEIATLGRLTPDDVRAALGHFHSNRTAASPAQVVAFVNVPADSPAAAIAATVGDYALAGATHVAVNAAGRDVDLERFVRFAAQEVAALVP